MIDAFPSDLFDKKVTVLNQTPLSGGDINAVYRVKTNYGTICIKQNYRDRFPRMLEKEARGLKELSAHSNFHIPDVIGHWEDETSQYLGLSFIETGTKSSSFWDDFGLQLAEMHQQSYSSFGWIEDNYIGSLQQSNSQHSNWSDFYAQERILPLVRLAFDNSLIDKDFTKNVEILCTKLESLFPKEAPSLLHGDLWSGNFMINSEGNPTLIDPAVYYGHREMDLGMMHLFGGFALEVFDIYNDHFPLEQHWKERIPLTQLYPLLVHVNLFGGSYIHSAKSVIQRYS